MFVCCFCVVVLCRLPAVVLLCAVTLLPPCARCCCYRRVAAVVWCWDICIVVLLLYCIAVAVHLYCGVLLGHLLCTCTLLYCMYVRRARSIPVVPVLLLYSCIALYYILYYSAAVLLYYSRHGVVVVIEGRKAYKKKKEIYLSCYPATQPMPSPCPAHVSSSSDGHLVYPSLLIMSYNMRSVIVPYIIMRKSWMSQVSLNTLTFYEAFFFFMSSF